MAGCDGHGMAWPCGSGKHDHKSPLNTLPQIPLSSRKGLPYSQTHPAPHTPATPASPSSSGPAVRGTPPCTAARRGGTEMAGPHRATEIGSAISVRGGADRQAQKSSRPPKGRGGITMCHDLAALGKVVLRHLLNPPLGCSTLPGRAEKQPPLQGWPHRSDPPTAPVPTPPKSPHTPCNPPHPR